MLDFSILCYRPWREEPGDESGGFVDGEMMDIFDVKITTLSSCRKTNERGRGAILEQSCCFVVMWMEEVMLFVVFWCGETWW